jgi:uncharacterized damage-inducible protein DinB
MFAEIERCVAVVEETKEEIKGIITGLDSETLNWTPLPTDANSIYQLVMHICGSEAQWIHETIGGIDVNRDRPAEFEASGDDVSVLQALLDANAYATTKVLESLTPEQLDEVRDTRTASGAMTVRQAILRQIHHHAVHLGHIQLTKQLYESQ